MALSINFIENMTKGVSNIQNPKDLWIKMEMARLRGDGYTYDTLAREYKARDPREYQAFIDWGNKLYQLIKRNVSSLTKKQRMNAFKSIGRRYERTWIDQDFIIESLAVEIYDRYINKFKISKKKSMPRMLPRITIGRKTFYVDKRLGQIRNVKDPSDFEPASRTLIEFWEQNNWLK